MATSTLTIKLPLLRLNKVKALEFERLQELNTVVANEVLALPKSERVRLTSKSFNHIEIGSAWINQTIRNANAKTKVKKFKGLPLETNNQNWSLHKTGTTYSLGFGLLRGIKKRVPIEIHQSSYQILLDGILAGTVKPGTLKLWRSRQGLWYAVISCTQEVPDAAPTQQWVGIDRGQNHLAVASTPTGTPQFWTMGWVKQVRKHYASKRRRLAQAGKHKTILKLENHERRIIRHVNHIISKRAVAFAKAHGCGIRLEDLSGIRHNSKQRQTTKRDASKNETTGPTTSWSSTSSTRL